MSIFCPTVQLSCGQKAGPSNTHFPRSFVFFVVLSVTYPRFSLGQQTVEGDALNTRWGLLYNGNGKKTNECDRALSQSLSWV